MADIIKILKAIRDNSSALYNDRVPEATKTNIQEVGNAILEYESTTNEFLDGLINRIAYTEVSNRRFKNPLAVLKGGIKPFGTDIEEIYINPVGAKTYDGSETSDMLEINKPDEKTIFHRLNRKDKYPVSVTYPELQQAFTSLNEMDKLLNTIITAMYSGDEMDEYLLMRNLVSSGITQNKIKTFDIEYDGGEQSSKDLIKLIKTLSGNFCFPSKEYNGYNMLNAEKIEAGAVTPCTTWCPAENQVLLVRTDVDASTDVEVLAKAFNMDKAQFMQRKFVVDSFGDSDTLCMICDEKMFKVYDNVYKPKSFENGSNLTTNYWLHHWQTISLSLFANAIAIKQKAVE